MTEKLVEYLVLQKCYYGGAIKEPGDVVYINEGEEVNPAVFCVREKYQEPEPEKEFLPKSHGGMMAQADKPLSEREKLEESARALGIKFTKRTTTDELVKLIKASSGK